MDAAAYFVQVDALYFQASENGVSYAISDHSVKNPEFMSRWGVKAKVGIGLPHDCWQLWFQFLHYHSRTKEEKSNCKILPTWGYPLVGSNGFADNVFNLWRLHMGLLDLNLSRCLLVSPCLEFYPFFGLRYAEVRHKLHIDYQGGTLFPGMENDFSMKNKFWGWGPEAGLEGFWRFNRWIGLFSRGALTLAFGKIYVHQDEELSDSSYQLKLINEEHLLRNIFELALGFDFRYCLDRCCREFYARIAWEAYLFLGQNQLVHFVDASMPGKFVTNQGDLSLQGLSLGLGLSF